MFVAWCSPSTGTPDATSAESRAWNGSPVLVGPVEVGVGPAAAGGHHHQVGVDVVERVGQGPPDRHVDPVVGQQLRHAVGDRGVVVPRVLVAAVSGEHERVGHQSSCGVSAYRAFDHTT